MTKYEEQERERFWETKEIIKNITNYYYCYFLLPFCVFYDL